MNLKEKTLTVILLVSGSAMTPDVLRSKSPMLRVIASRPLTCGWPKLFHVIKPPVLRILQKQTHGDQKICTQCLNLLGEIRLPIPLFFIFSLRCVIHSEFEGLAFAAQHGSAVPYAGHHQLDPVSQQGHCGRGPCTQQRGCNTAESKAAWLVCDALKVTETVKHAIQSLHLF